MQHTISRDGTQIAYWTTGSGPPLLLVHGSVATHQRWDDITPRLAEHLTVITMDRRGRGESGDGPTYSLQREGEDVAAVAEAVGGSVAVLGHSYGANCVLEAAPLSDAIDRLILYEPGVPTTLELYPPGFADRMRELMQQGAMEDALVLMLREVVRMSDDELAAYRQLPMWPVRVSLVPTIPREMVVEETFVLDRERYGRLEIPVLFLTGGESPPELRQPTETLHAILPNSRLVILPGQSHIAMDSAPELFRREVLAFMRA